MNYIKLPITIPSEKILKEIIMGPKMKMTERELADKLIIYKSEDVVIRKSKVPYR